MMPTETRAIVAAENRSHFRFQFFALFSKIIQLAA